MQYTLATKTTTRTKGKTNNKNKNFYHLPLPFVCTEQALNLYLFLGSNVFS